MASVRLWAWRLHKDFSSACRTLCAPNEIPTSPPTIVSCSVPPSPERDPLFPSFHARHRQRSLTFSHRGHQASPAPGPCPRLMLVFLTNTLTSPHSHDSHPTQGASLRALDSCSPRPVSAAALSLAWDTEPGLSHCAVSQVTGRVVPLELCGEEASICLAPPAVSLES